MRLRTVVFMSVFAAVCAPALAAEDPVAFKERANADMRAAEQMMRQADELLNSGISEDKMRTVLPLYVKAGQMFEEAARLYQALRPNYATELDVNNAQQALGYCLKNIAEIKKRLGVP